MPKPEKFETSLKKLEGLVEKLESGDLSLEESLKSYEEGMKLAKACQNRLEETRRKVEILTKEGLRKPFPEGEE